MRASRGFTLVELMVVVVIVAVVSALVVMQGRSARHNAQIAGGAYELALRIGGLKARAMSDGREHVLVVADTVDAAACRESEASCGRTVVLRAPDAGFPDAFRAGWNPDAPPIGGETEVVDDGGSQRIARNAQFDDADSGWRPPPPFRSVAAFDANIVFTCTGGRRCFALRFLPDGEVRPVIKPNTPIPADREGERGRRAARDLRQLPGRAREDRRVLGSPAWPAPSSVDHLRSAGRAAARSSSS
jgi:prepilin-type N-terminal cleavage/methylation domain-containing protein